MKLPLTLAVWLVTAGTGSVATARQPASGAAPRPTSLPKCADPKHRATDFLVGKWRIVQTANGRHYAENVIERVHDDCAIRDTLRFQDGTVGGSLIFFKPIDGLWHIFYHDSAGNSAHLTGLTDPQGRQEVGGDIVFPQLGGQPRKVRQITQTDAIGRPRQIGYILSDKDIGWHQFYDLTFCPANRADPRNEPPC